jgi:hypothetical protein
MSMTPTETQEFRRTVAIHARDELRKAFNGLITASLNDTQQQTGFQFFMDH